MLSEYLKERKKRVVHYSGCLFPYLRRRLLGWLLLPYDYVRFTIELKKYYKRLDALEEILGRVEEMIKDSKERE